MQEPEGLELEDTLSKELELQAKLQAERQQAALMRKALEERDRALKELEDQCQVLQDDLEDRNREMDHLNRKMEQVKSTPKSANRLGVLDTPKPRMNMANSLASSDRSLDISELFNADAFDYAPKNKISWQPYIKIITTISIIGAVGAVVVLLWIYLPNITAIFKPKIQTSDTLPADANAPPPNQIVAIAPTTNPAPVPKVNNTAAAVYVPQPPIRDRLRSGGSGPKMLKLPPGIFSMGNKNAYGTSDREEQPAHNVRINEFYIASYEACFDEYDRFARATKRPLPDDSGFGRGNRPVINVSWNDAQAYTDWLSSETGHHYYLPSEAQWEYAARAGTDTRYWWGNTPVIGQAVCFSCGTPWDSVSTAPVGSLQPNAFGLYDTSGNVMEWVEDCYNSDYNGAPSDVSPWLSGDCSLRMVRGGAFNKPVTLARSNSRFKLPVEGTFNMLGFRVARD